jgi:hypothetical protein
MRKYIITSQNTGGSGGFSFHEVFKIVGNKGEYIGNRMSCSDVKREKNRLIFIEYGFHCDRFNFFEDDGEIVSSSIELK